ncbi:hypothetical protein [uncultured Pseudodesulfovibrio sp.]|uniref:hypothetical protein n=1 Tax=uncultured Pseudodesulfovibrio sp. TaxID=2035858 RepID=UPI0029C7C2E7|nr:hypothetical protein [uncultured Pseudodesulfovibrio sp.]
MNQEDEWIRADTLKSRWELSPYDVINILDGGKLPFRRVCGWGTPTIWTLNEAEVHIIDLIRWEKLYLEKERAALESGITSQPVESVDELQTAEPPCYSPEETARALKESFKNMPSSQRKQTMANLLDERFPGELSHAKMGALIADEGESLAREARIQRAKRARNPKS